MLVWRGRPRPRKGRQHFWSLALEKYFESQDALSTELGKSKAAGGGARATHTVYAAKSPAGCPALAAGVVA